MDAGKAVRPAACRRGPWQTRFFARAAWLCTVITLLLSPLTMVGGAWSHDETRPLETVVGLASYYADSLHGRVTASGEIFDRDEMVAAHPHYPFGTRVRVTNPENGHAILVRINDRGPTKKNQDEGVIIDLSPAAAAELDIIEAGRARVVVEVREWGEVKN